MDFEELPFRGVYQILRELGGALSHHPLPTVEFGWDSAANALVPPNHHHPPDPKRDPDVLELTLQHLSGHSDDIGIFLSGGLDSGLLSAVGTRVGIPLVAFTCGISEASFDETSHATLVAKALGIHCESIVLDRRTFLMGLVRNIVNSGLPLTYPNQVGLSLLAEHAARLGVKSVLCGEGSDELFCGYPRLLSLRDRISGTTAAMPSGQDGRPLAGYDQERELGILRGSDDLAQLAFGFDERLALSTRLWELTRAIDDVIERELRIAWMLEFFQTLPWSLLRLSNAANAGGVEVCLPYLGEAVFEIGLRALPSLSRLPQTKPCIRRIAEGLLPGEILTLPKRGFELPLDLWLPQASEIIGEGLEALWDIPYKMLQSWAVRQPGSADLRWAMLNLEIWSQIFVLHRTEQATSSWLSESA